MTYSFVKVSMASFRPCYILRPGNATRRGGADAHGSNEVNLMGTPCKVQRFGNDSICMVPDYSNRVCCWREQVYLGKPLANSKICALLLSIS